MNFYRAAFRKNTVFVLIAVTIALPAFAQEAITPLATEDRFVHDSKVFSIVPPKGYKETLTHSDGAQFINLVDKSFFSVSFSEIVGNYTDTQLLERFNDTDFRKSFISNLESSSLALQTKVKSTRPRTVGGIAAFEFVTEGLSGKGVPLQNDFIVFYKDHKEFIIILGAAKDFFTMDLPFFEEALSSFKVIESAQGTKPQVQ